MEDSTRREHLEAALGPDYDLKQLIGRGGFGEVYLARDLRLERDVAVKTIRWGLGGDEALERFRREAKAVARLRHPAIMPVYQIGESAGVTFMVMPFIPGGSLRDKMEKEGRFGLDESLRIVAQIAEALQQAHDAGLIHRDIKPENILFEKGNDRVLLADFGISKALDATLDSLTGTGQTLGTPAYSSPEQATGSEHVDHRSDQYSLACVLFEMLTGDPPFPASSPQAIIAKHISESPPSARTVRPDLPEVIDDALRQSLSKTPNDRFPSVQHFSRALASKDSQPRSRRRVGGLALTSSLLAIATLAIWAASTSHNEGPPRLLLADHQLLTYGADVVRGTAPEVSPDGRFVAYLSSNGELRLQEIGRTLPEVLHTFREGRNYRGVPLDTVLRWSEETEENPLRGSPRTLVEWSPDGAGIYFRWGLFGIQYLDLRSRRLTSLDEADPVDDFAADPATGQLATLNWMPDSSRLPDLRSEVRVAIRTLGEDSIFYAEPLTTEWPRILRSMVWTDEGLVVAVRDTLGTRLALLPRGESSFVTRGHLPSVLTQLTRDETGQVMALTVDGEVSTLAFGPDGIMLRPVEGLPASPISGFSAHSSGQFVYSLVEETAAVWVAPVVDGLLSGETVQVSPSRGAPSLPALSPRGDSVAFFLDTALVIVSSDGSGIREVWADDRGTSYQPVIRSWLSSGRSVVIGVPEGGDYVVGLDTGAAREAPEGVLTADGRTGFELIPKEGWSEEGYDIQAVRDGQATILFEDILPGAFLSLVAVSPSGDAVLLQQWGWRRLRSDPDTFPDYRLLTLSLATGDVTTKAEVEGNPHGVWGWTDSLGVIVEKRGVSGLRSTDQAWSLDETIYPKGNLHYLGPGFLGSRWDESGPRVAAISANGRWAALQGGLRSTDLFIARMTPRDGR